MPVAQVAVHDQRRLMLAFAALVLCAVAMGASPIFVRFADVGPYASAFWRTFLALPFLWAWARVESGTNPLPTPPPQGGRERKLSGLWAERQFGLTAPILLAGVFFAGDLFFWHLSILATTIANATFLATTSPIWVALGAWLVLSERIGVRMLIGLALCIGGGLALVGESYAVAPERVRGDLYGLATAVFFGAYILAMRAARADVSAARLAFLSTAVTAGCLFVIAVLFDTTLMTSSWSGAAALVALALVSQVGGQGLLSVALGTLPATFSALVIFLEAIAAAAFGWIVFGEALGLPQALGGLLILFGIWTARPRVEAAAEAVR